MYYVYIYNLWICSTLVSFLPYLNHRHCFCFCFVLFCFCFVFSSFSCKLILVQLNNGQSDFSKMRENIWMQNEIFKHFRTEYINITFRNNMTIHIEELTKNIAYKRQCEGPRGQLILEPFSSPVDEEGRCYANQKCLQCGNLVEDVEHCYTPVRYAYWKTKIAATERSRKYSELIQWIQWRRWSDWVEPSFCRVQARLLFSAGYNENQTEASRNSDRQILDMRP